MTQDQAARSWFIKTALSYIGTPYRWGGDDPSGYDCSGFVVECLKSAGCLGYGDYTANGLLAHFANRRDPEPDAGFLVFRLDRSGRACHVAICLDRWFAIGAGGGDQSTLDRSDAWEHNAFVKIRPITSKSANRRICDPFATPKE